MDTHKNLEATKPVRIKLVWDPVSTKTFNSKGSPSIGVARNIRKSCKCSPFCWTLPTTKSGHAVISTTMLVVGERTANKGKAAQPPMVKPSRGQLEMFHIPLDACVLHPAKISHSPMSFPPPPLQQNGGIEDNREHCPRNEHGSPRSDPFHPSHPSLDPCPPETVLAESFQWTVLFHP